MLTTAAASPIPSTSVTSSDEEMSAPVVAGDAKATADGRSGGRGGKFAAAGPAFFWLCLW